MKKISKNILAILLSVIMVLSVLPATAFAEAGPKPVDPQSEDMFFSGIGFYAFNDDGSLKWEQIVDPDNPDIGYGRPVCTPVYDNGEVFNNVIEGVSYDADKNKLTLDNVNLTDRILLAYGMGDDFRVEVIGECAVANIVANGAGWGCALNIIGNGTLTVNEAKVFAYGIEMSSEESYCALNLSPELTADIYGSAGAVAVYDSYLWEADWAIGLRCAEEDLPEIVSEQGTEKREVYYDGYVYDIRQRPQGLGRIAVNPDDPDGIYTANDYWYMEDNQQVFGRDVDKYIYCEPLGGYIIDPSFERITYHSETEDVFADCPFEVTDDELENETANLSRCVWSDVYVDGEGNHFAYNWAWSNEDWEEKYYLFTYEEIEGYEDIYVFKPAVVGTEEDIQNEIAARGLEWNGERLKNGYLIGELEYEHQWLGYPVVNKDDPDGIYLLVEGSRRLYDDEGNPGEDEEGVFIRKYIYYQPENLDTEGFYIEDGSFGREYGDEYGDYFVTKEFFNSDKCPFSYAGGTQEDILPVRNNGSVWGKYVQICIGPEDGVFYAVAAYDEEDDTVYRVVETIDKLCEYEDEWNYRTVCLLVPDDDVDLNDIEPYYEEQESDLRTYYLTDTDYHYVGENAGGEYDPDEPVGPGEDESIEGFNIEDVWTYPMISNNPDCEPRFIPFTGRVTLTEGAFMIDEIWTNTVDGSTSSLEEMAPLKPGYAYTYTAVVNDRPGYYFADDITVTYEGNPVDPACIKYSDDHHTMFVTLPNTVTFLLDTPEGITVSPAANGVDVGWDAVNGRAMYRVFRKEGSSGWKTVGNTSDNTFTDTTAVSGKTYSYTVRCVSEDGKVFESGYNSKGKSITYVAQPKITKIENAYTGVKLTVAKVDGAAKYRIYRKSGTGNWAKVADTASLTYTDTTVKSGTDYVYTVRALDKSGNLVSSYNATGWSISYIAAPKISKIENVYTGVQLTIAKSEGASKYRIYRKSGSGSWAKLADTTSLTYVDTTAKSGTKYAYTVRCLSNDGKSFTSSYNNTGWSITYAAAPKISKFENVASGTKLTWSASTGAAKYRVFIKNGSSWKALGDVTSTSYTYTAAKSGTAYTYTVRAIGKDGKFLTGYNNAGWKYTFIATPALPTLKNTKSGVQITIAKVTGAAQYRIYRKTGSGSWAKLADTTSLTYVDKTAKNGTKYAYTIRCLSADGKSFTSSYNNTGRSITCKK